MSEEELVSAYLDGRVSRRVFIRRLMATGLSAGAALSLATVVGPAAFGQVPAGAGSGTNGGNGGYRNSQGQASGGTTFSGGRGGNSNAGNPGGSPGS